MSDDILHDGGHVFLVSDRVTGPNGARHAGVHALVVVRRFYEDDAVQDREDDGRSERGAVRFSTNPLRRLFRKLDDPVEPAVRAAVLHGAVGYLYV